VLGVLLGVGEEFPLERGVGGGTGAARARAGDRS
jgi:hypothetical protein